VLYVGDDRPEDHHDVGLVDETGRRLGRAQLSEGVAGIARFHELVADHLPEADGPGQVVIGIETDRSPWVTALVASGYRVYAINPMSVARYRERHSTSGAKSDAGDAWLLAGLVRTDAARHRPVAGDSPAAGDQGAGPLAAAADLGTQPHRAAAAQPAARLLPRGAAGIQGLGCRGRAGVAGPRPGSAAAARLSKAQIAAALKKARRHQVQHKAAAVQATLRAPQLTQPAELTAAYAAAVAALTKVIGTFNEQIAVLEQQLSASFRGHRSAGIDLSQPGLGMVLAARQRPRAGARRRGRMSSGGTSAAAG
jgi:hypothetical protein